MNRTRALTSLALLAFILCGSSCLLSREYVNAELDPRKLAALDPGTTTAREVVELLGAPAEVVQLGRRSAYRYEHAQEKLSGLSLLFVVFFVNSDTQSDRVWVFFDESDVLTHVGVTLQANEAEYAMPWVDHD